MAVRVRLRIRSRTGAEAAAPALINSGYEAETPQLLIPRSLAGRLGLWPPPPEAFTVDMGTAGGPVRNYTIPRAGEVWVEASDRVVGPVAFDGVISGLEYEVLVSDRLGGELGIAILDLRGLWRFSDENRIRSSEPPSVGSGSVAVDSSLA